jgi:hypothetical protein
MTRTIQSIRVQSSKYSINVYINFSDGTSGVRSYDATTKTWTSSKNLDAATLAEAKKLAYVSPKWSNYTAPRTTKISTTSTTTKIDDEDISNSDMTDYRNELHTDQNLSGSTEEDFSNSGF